MHCRSGVVSKWELSEISPSKVENTGMMARGECGWGKDDGLVLRSADYEVQGTHPDGRGQTELGETGLETGSGVRPGTVPMRYGHVGETVDVRLESLCQWLKNTRVFCDTLGENI